jgi:hypothetical protein
MLALGPHWYCGRLPCARKYKAWEMIHRLRQKTILTKAYVRHYLGNGAPGFRLGTPGGEQE